VAVDLNRFHAGDESLFAELVAEYSPRLLPYLRRYAGADADAGDLLQDLWLRAFTKRRTFDGRGSLIGWLLMIARSVGVTAVRRRTREPVVEDLRDISAPAEPDTSPSRDALRDAVLALPERQRDVVLLRLIEGLSTAETARRLHCAEGTVKATLHHATRNLRAALEETVS
jgi:RNA polymerase sigma-70 factor (ECF subfamily)